MRKIGGKTLQVVRQDGFWQQFTSVYAPMYAGVVEFLYGNWWLHLRFLGWLYFPIIVMYPAGDFPNLWWG